MAGVYWGLKACRVWGDENKFWFHCETESVTALVGDLGIAIASFLLSHEGEMNGDDERLEEEGNGAEKGTWGEEGRIGRLFCRIDSHSKRCSVMNVIFLITYFTLLFLDSFLCRPVWICVGILGSRLGMSLPPFLPHRLSSVPDPNSWCENQIQAIPSIWQLKANWSVPSTISSKPCWVAHAWAICDGGTLELCSSEGSFEWICNIVERLPRPRRLDFNIK
jgi:hypothetical protein